MGTVERFSTSLQPGGDSAPAILAALEAAERFIERAAIPPVTAARLGIVVEELVSNALRHGAADSALTLELTLSAAAGNVRVDLADDGLSFDPTAERQFTGPDPATGGGVGLALIRAWAVEVSYRREGGRNHLCLTLDAEG